jgi:uncharacterized OB-fold protein/acyl dehydratase
MTGIADAARRIAARGDSPARLARDPVNLPMIRNWVEALGDDNPIYIDPDRAARTVHGGLVAPPAMTQVWTMRGLRPIEDSEDPLRAMSELLDGAGYTSVVATNSEQTYHRYLRPGEQASVRSRLDGVVGPKRTALGEGWFVTTRSTWYVDGEAVAEMLFRVLKYRPAPASPAGTALRPLVSRDTEFFWAGTATGELRVQHCAKCELLRHPPGPMCPGCGATDPGYIVAAGTGEVFSYVVHHHPPVPGRRPPYVVALVELTEGVRLMAELVDVPPDEVRIGMPVRADFIQVDGDLTLPVWHPRSSRSAQLPGNSGHGDPLRQQLPGSCADLHELRIDVTPTFVISTALATRDFQDVHHDRDRAVARGSKDIFLNILTTTGLVQRYVTDWAGPDAVLRRIAVRLGVPCYAGDTLSLTGRVTERSGDECTVEVVGRNSLGDHVTGTVQVWAPS